MRISRIDITESILMLILAACIDLLEIILTLFAVGAAVELVSGIVQYGIFGIWFYFHGTIFFTKKGAGKGATPKPTPKSGSGDLPSVDDLKVNPAQIVMLVLESIPVVGALPFFTVSVFMKILDVNKQAREKEVEEKDPNVLREAKNKTPQGSNVLQFASNKSKGEDFREAA